LQQIDSDTLVEEDDQGMQFRVLVDNAQRDAKPIVLWIHPGDACEHDHDDEEVRDNANDFENGMGEEILALADTHRIVVLHRQSTPYAFDPGSQRVDESYWDAMGEAIGNPENIHLWGDDLDAASDWVLEHLGLAPAFFLTGAWNDPEHGCVAAVGKALVKAGKHVDVSMWSPSVPGTLEDTWRPEQERIKLAGGTRKKPKP
jgi:hypothetical protein